MCVCVCLTDGKCILRWMHIISYKNEYLIRWAVTWPKGILSMDVISKPTSNSSMSTSSILIYFHGKFFSLRSVFLATDLFSFSFIMLHSLSLVHFEFVRCFLVLRMYTILRISDDDQEFFHVTGNYNQLNQFPVLKKRQIKSVQQSTTQHKRI